MQITIDEIAVQQSTCQHPHPTVYVTGWMTFENGEVTDTQIEHLFCHDCGCNLTPAGDEIEIPY